jgi:hypothetical protein
MSYLFHLLRDKDTDHPTKKGGEKIRSDVVIF